MTDDPTSHNEPAFPSTNSLDEGRVVKIHYGMSLRDYFAGQAMAGWLASYGQEVMHPAIIEGGCDDVARDAYQIADAMLKAREGKT